MNVLLIDNYDSFTYNLFQYLKIIDDQPLVYRNNEITVSEVSELEFDYILISPGPSSPKEAGVSIEVIKMFGDRYPILGVCLGHQAIASVYGGTVEKAVEPMHGKTSKIIHDNKTIFEGLPLPLQVTRYHSLIVKEENLPSSLQISARTENGEIMAIRHKHYSIEGVQFHPESIISEKGIELFRNFKNKVVVPHLRRRNSIYV